MAYNKWSDSDQLAQLKACLTSTAANVMWDSDPTNVEDLPRLWQTLADRFGGHDLTEEAIMRDCFIEALDPDLALKLREKEVANLDQVLSSALKL